MAVSEEDIAAKLIERLLTDPAFRARFRRDPASACREAGLENLAQEMSIGAGSAMMTLESRESRSSLAGVMMAAAMEGIGVYEFTKHVVPGLDGVDDAIGDVLSRVNLPSIQGALAGGPEPAPAAAPAKEEEPAAAAGAAPAPTAPPAEPAKPPEKEPPPVSPEQAAAAAIAEAEKPPSDEEKAAAAAAAIVEQEKPQLPSATDLPDAPPEPELPSADAPPELAPASPEQAAAGAAAPADASPAAAPPAPAETAAPSRPPDPSEYGREGTGGPMTPEVKALLENPNLHFDEVGVKDLKEGRIDPRAIAVLTKLSQEHEITVSCMCSDHPRGPTSNHYYGRGVDIAAIDGEIVRPGSAAARELASEIADLDSTLRPSEVGTPFAIASPGYFTDAAHQDHIHIGWDEEITSDWRPPADVASPAAPFAAAASPEAAAAGAAPAGDSGAFLAVTADAAGRAGFGGGKPSDSGAFLAVPADAPPPPAAGVAEAGVMDLTGVSGDYPGDSASKDQIAAWMAKKAEAAGLPPELPVMAGLVESGLRNLNYGDADSVGFFQMRVGIWNKGDYAGYPEDPQKQIQWFIDQALAVKQQRISRGLPVDDPAHYGEWIADVERPAEQYRGRYQLRLQEARNLLKQAAASAPAVDAGARVGVAADELAPSGAGTVDPKAAAALAEAKKHMGLAYKWGGESPDTGFDCSGLVQYVFGKQGIEVPRVAEDQFEVGAPVDRGALRPGDLVFFADETGYVYHVGISLGGDKFIHSPKTGDVIKVSSLDEPYFDSVYHGAKRYAGAGAEPSAIDAPAPPPAPPAAEPAAAPAPAPAPPENAVLGEQRAAKPKKSDSAVFLALSAQEASYHKATAVFLQAVDPKAAELHAAGMSPEEAAAAAAQPEPAGRSMTSDDAIELADDVDPHYPGDDASQSELARWLARSAESRGLPPELPVMAALVESGVRNLDHGHADSVGFFQMRLGIWNQGEYAGYPQRPELQAKWFVDQALEVKRQAIARGDTDFGKDPSTWGEWIADVERPAEQYRGRYQLRLDEARRLLRG